MATTHEKNRFGLSPSVDDHMTILKVLAKNDHEAISRFWKTPSNDASTKAMLFHTLAMLDPERLHAWIASTPTEWWSKHHRADVTGNDSRVAERYQSVCDRYSTMAGGMLHYLYLENRPVFLDLLAKSPHIFMGASCRYYMAQWCEDLGPKEVAVFQPLLAAQISAWYTLKPERILLLTALPGRREEELMLAAAMADNAVLHPLLEDKYPGMQTCIHIAQGMLGDTRQKKMFVRQWLMSKHGAARDELTLALPEL